ncbi:MAG: hypothetical protein AAB719_00680 [Patescibacteria group bacterium]
MIEVIPAILAENESDLSLKLKEIPSEFKLVHIDVLKKDIWTETNLNFEAHLMVSHPEEIVETWIKRGATKIIVHELNDKINSFRGRVEIGLAVELHVPLEKVFPFVSKIDFLHLMSIATIGKQGNPLDERIFDRIKIVREKFPTLVISVDGGVNVTNFEKLKQVGVDRFVVGSGFKDLWKSLTKN